MKFYVYNLEDNEHVATISGSGNEACEAVFDDRFGDDYGATYSPAFGINGGLVRNAKAREINADET